MNEQKVRSNLKKLVVVFLVICLLIGGVSQYLFRSVTNLYTESIQGRLEERALQYKQSFMFKTNSDLYIGGYDRKRYGKTRVSPLGCQQSGRLCPFMLLYAAGERAATDGAGDDGCH